MEEKGAEVNSLSLGSPNYEFEGSKYTPLHFAAEAGYVEITEVLVNSNADVDAKNNDEWTPLHVAAEKNYTNIKIGCTI